MCAMPRRADAAELVVVIRLQVGLRRPAEGLGFPIDRGVRHGRPPVPHRLQRLRYACGHVDEDNRERTGPRRPPFRSGPRPCTKRTPASCPITFREVVHCAYDQHGQQDRERRSAQNHGQRWGEPTFACIGGGLNTSDQLLGSYGRSNSLRTSVLFSNTSYQMPKGKNGMAKTLATERPVTT